MMIYQRVSSHFLVQEPIFTPRHCLSRSTRRPCDFHALQVLVAKKESPERIIQQQGLKKSPKSHLGPGPDKQKHIIDFWLKMNHISEKSKNTYKNYVIVLYCYILSLDGYEIALLICLCHLANNSSVGLFAN